MSALSMEDLNSKKDISITLVRAVKNYPALWDKTHAGYREKQTRDKTWKKIQKELMPDYYDRSETERCTAKRLLIRKWNNIRDHYRRIKSKKTRADKLYKYSDELEFLDDFIDSHYGTGKDMEFEASGATEDVDSNSDQDESNKPMWKYCIELSMTDIIRAVKTQPILWDTKVPGARNKKARKNAWEEVCKAVVPNYSQMDASQRHTFGLTVTKKWQSARDSYLKSYKAKLQVKDNFKPYIYDAEINFLDTVFKETVNDQGNDRGKNQDNDQGNDESNDSEHDMSHSDEEMPNFEENEIVYFDLDSTSDHNQSNKLTIDNTISTANNVNISQDESVISILSNLIQKEGDDDNAFFKSITPAVKSLTEESKFEFRIEVMHLIKRLKKSDKQKKRMKIEIDSD